MFWKEQLEDTTVLFFNSTPQGGGVALMRHDIVRVYRAVGIENHVCLPIQDYRHLASPAGHLHLAWVDATRIESCV